MSSVEMLSGEGLYDPWFEHDACGIGFLVDIKGHKSHDILRDAIAILKNLEHRGACGCEKDTGDGAGILFQIPHTFFLNSCHEAGIELPGPGQYGVGMVFLPTDPYERYHCEWMLEEVVRREGLQTLGWRTVPVDESRIGHSAKATAPVVRQIFVQNSDGLTPDAFERKLYIIRKQVEKEVLRSKIRQKSFFYICSLSARTIVYKGMLKADQLQAFYPDLLDGSIETALAMVHSRFSTNTFPSWPRAHPYRYICHNGEINTLRGNVNWMRTRESMFRSELFGDDIKKIIPVVDETGSDSAMFDNVLELLVMAGRSLPHSMMMMIPEPWRRDLLMSAEKREFYQYHSCLMEPWDGPAAIAFTDGVQIGAILDRNGLRPSRYYVTDDGLVIMASEVGVLDVPPEKITYKGRLQPGRMLLVDTAEGRIISDEELKHRIATEKPYGKWVRENLITLDDLPEPSWISPPDSGTLRTREVAFGYTTEDLKMILGPMAEFAVEPIGSMGNDTPLAVLSDRPQPLYNYFKQLFAQVTNPPVDAIREDLIMDIGTTIGPDGNLLEPVPEAARQIELNSPILSNEELEKLRQLDGSKSLGDAGIRFKTRTIRILFPADEGPSALSRAVDKVCEECRKAIEEGCEILILSDRGVDGKWAPIPALLAAAGVHHYLIRSGLRGSVGIVVESGEPREIHHFALLIGYGASAVNPYLAFETLNRLIREKKVAGISYEEAVEHYIKAVNKGVVKVMSKMGISTIQSYHGAQIFEAVGLSDEVISRYFTGTPSRIGGVGLDVIAQEVLLRHERAFPSRNAGPVLLEEGGHYQWRHNGEGHLFSPEVVHKLQYACRTNDFEKFKEYTRAVDEQSRKLFTLRGLFDFNYASEPIPLEEVEPVESIVRRFKTGAMSYGSISKEAHEALAIAMNRIGGKSNTGEGGEDSGRYVLDPNGDSRSSAIKQVASGRFGVTSEYLVNAQEIQIKMAQGAKPGEGGQLPGHKVYPEIARVRYSTPGVGLISPPPHHDIYSIEDLAELIHDLKNSNRHARIS
ncbi:MAG TPA: glutamate synthase large subunit, partial [Acidobacteriota bacterium]|nr:glutamate synthase large subunit [Acidobacteriota bacterium]